MNGLALREHIGVSLVRSLLRGHPLNSSALVGGSHGDLDLGISRVVIGNLNSERATIRLKSLPEVPFGLLSGELHFLDVEEAGVQNYLSASLALLQSFQLHFNGTDTSVVGELQLQIGGDMLGFPDVIVTQGVGISGLMNAGVNIVRDRAIQHCRGGFVHCCESPRACEFRASRNR